MIVLTPKMQFVAELHSVAQEEIEILRNELELFGLDTDQTQYRRGQITSLRRLPELMEAAQKRIDDRNS